MGNINSMSRRNALVLKKNSTTDIGCTIKGLVVCNGLDKEPWDLQNGLALGCYKPFPEVLMVLIFFFSNQLPNHESITKLVKMKI